MTLALLDRAGCRKTAAEHKKHRSGIRLSGELNCADLANLATWPGVCRAP